VRTAGFFSGRGNGVLVLSSLAAAAGGGVKAELGRRIIESGEPLKAIFGAMRQGPKTGSRYARLHAAAPRAYPETRQSYLRPHPEELANGSRECAPDDRLRKRIEGCEASGLSWFETAQERLLTMRDKLQHRKTARLRSARKRLVEQRDLRLAQRQFPRRRIVDGVFRRRGLWNSEH